VDPLALRIGDRLLEGRLAPLADEEELRSGRHLVDDLRDGGAVVLVEREPSSAEVPGHERPRQITGCLPGRVALEARVDDGDLRARAQVTGRLPRRRVRARDALTRDGEVHRAERRSHGRDRGSCDEAPKGRGRNERLDALRAGGLDGASNRADLRRDRARAGAASDLDDDAQPRPEQRQAQRGRLRDRSARRASRCRGDAGEVGVQPGVPRRDPLGVTKTSWVEDALVGSNRMRRKSREDKSRGDEQTGRAHRRRVRRSASASRPRASRRPRAGRAAGPL
jgi:hypothetical protein